MESSNSDSEPDGHDYILVIAHPDDESMFFLPALTNLLKFNSNSAKCRIHILCLSNGNYDGLGEIRSTELKCAASCILSMSQSQSLSMSQSLARLDVSVINHPGLQDGPKESWSKHCIEGVVLDFLDTRYCNNNNCNDNHNGSDNGSDNDKTDDRCKRKRKRNVTVLTFDAGGVSGHTNHIDTYSGLLHIHYLFQQQQQEQQQQRQQQQQEQEQQDGQQDGQQEGQKGQGQTQHDGNSITTCTNNKLLAKVSSKINFQLLTLDTVRNPIVKYFPFVELFYILLMKCWYTFVLTLTKTLTNVDMDVETEMDMDMDMETDVDVMHYYMFNPVLVWRAMKAHSTQFVWYRRLFVIFSRYSYINTLRKVKVKVKMNENENGDANANANGNGDGNGDGDGKINEKEYYWKRNPVQGQGQNQRQGHEHQDSISMKKVE